MSPSAGGNTAPRFSIVIARASTEETVLDVLSAVRRQETSDSYEIILADRNDDDVTRRVAAGHPEVIVVRAAPATCLPELRTMAMRRGQGQLVVVTGDYCVPEPDWLQSFSRAFEEAPDGVIAAGGCVLDGRPRTLADQAAFYLEYSTLLPPIPEGLVAQLPGMNVCYKRAALDGISDDVLARGFWEHTLHPRLQQTGHRFWSSEQIRIRNVRAYPWAASTRQRFLYSKHFAGTRFERSRYLRWPALIVSPVLPVLLLARLTRNMLGRPGHRCCFLAGLPFTLWLVTVATIGEMCGCVFGPGRALEKIE